MIGYVTGWTPEKLEEIKKDPYYAKKLKRLRENGERFLTTEPPRIKFSDIHLFVTTGNRSNYERVYGAYRSRMSTYAMLYMLDKDERYIEPLADILWNICDFETWGLPAHVPEDYELDLRYRFLELVSCNIGRTLGEVLLMAGDKLPELVVKRVKNEVRERIIEGFRRYSFGWKKGTNNWSAVCIAGVLGSYVYFATREETEAAIPEMLESIECYLRGFDKDGCCLEGYGYWTYGFSFFCYFADLLRNYTDGRINLFADPRVLNIAKFQENCAINETQCVRFSDCSEGFRPSPMLSHFLKNEYSEIQIPSIPAPEDNENDIRNLLWLDPKLQNSVMKPKSCIYHEAQWFIYRSEAYNFACKAGYNAESHNHNDVGSFMISKNGRVTFTDPGGGEYTRQYFGKERYTILEPSSRGHSVPIINGELQQFGLKEKSAIYAEREREYAFSMENAYSIESLKSLKRSFTCESDAIIMTDTYELTEEPSSIVERFVTLVQPELKDGAVYCGASVLEYDTGVLEAELSTDTCVRSATVKETLYIVDLKVKEPKKNMELTFKFS